MWQAAAPMAQSQIDLASARSLEAEDADADADAGPGFMDILAEGEVAMTSMSQNLQTATAITEGLGAIAQDSMVEIAKANESGLGFAGRLNIAKKLAARFEEPAARLDELSADYARLVELSDASSTYLIDQIEQDPSNIAEACEVLRSMVQLAESSDEAAVGLTGFVQEVRRLRKIAQALGPVSRSIERSVGRYVTSATIFGRWKGRIEALPGWERCAEATS
jgi:hypothetical protein